METYLGIDGGGSKTRALLVDAEGNILHTAESGPSNLNAYEFDVVRASLTEVIQQCLDATGEKPRASCFGLAGSSASSTRKALDSIIARFELESARIVTDAEIALEGAFHGGLGILLIAGTGSVCFGKSPDGTIHRTGGWGWLADDAGSAAWIGQKALEAAVQQHDGRIDGHTMKNAVFSRLGIHSGSEINLKLYQPPLSRSALGELATSVMELKQARDPIASAIHEEALHALDKLVHTTADKMGHKSSEVALAGGLLTHNPGFAEGLKARLKEFTIGQPRSSPLQGAIALARK